MAFAAGGATAARGLLPPGRDSTDRRRSRSPRWSGRARPSAGPTSRWPPPSFGHGIAVTPLQFLDAVGGLVRRRDAGAARPCSKRDPDDLPPHTRYVSRAHRRDMMRWLMWLVVEQGTGTKAQARQLRDRRQDRHRREGRRAGGYSTDRVLASFLGAFPIDDPRYLVFVSLDEPQGRRRHATVCTWRLDRGARSSARSSTGSARSWACRPAARVAAGLRARLARFSPQRSAGARGRRRACAWQRSAMTTSA